MLTAEEKEIYSRHLLLEEVGLEGQLKLKNARVLVIGAGGLGCPVLQYICAAGIGTIGIADHDTVDKSNLQRQILFGYSSLGKSKALEAKKRLSDLNPTTKITTYTDGITIENALDIIDLYDAVVDCTDNYQTRYLVNDACIILNKPLIYGAIHKFEGQVAIFNYKNGPSYRCLYPDAPKQASISNCAESGVIGVLPGIVGSLQANEVIKLFTGIGELLSGKILLYHGLKNTVDTFSIPKRKSDFTDQLKIEKKLHSENYQIVCNPIEVQLDLKEIKQQYRQVLDVREIHESPEVTLLNPIRIPMSEIEQRFHELDPSLETLVLCQSGIRSKKAIEFLKTKLEIKKIDNLEGGVNALHLTQ
ncbi:MAG: molybdopterin-synthase adenylyltransferase MoeB [Crocinitomicaceae bacterium]|nr:molybdopterin-synthase adenylyltransferase MoeB [Crocinitomicaceae bacterium]